MEQRKRHQAGLGFNPAFASGDLKWPKSCKYVEAGTSLIMDSKLLSAFSMVAPQVSLHLARVPMCEPDLVQDKFLENLFAQIPEGLHSVGMHLCGPYRENMGHFGLSTMFRLNDKNRQRAERFLYLAKDKAMAHGCQLLIENANFYEESVESALAGIDYVSTVCKGLNIRLILDVAHLVMAAHNVGLDPAFALGRVALENVGVIHLSGIRVGRNGEYHDGHNLPVNTEVWALAKLALTQIRESVHVVLEHTDPIWSKEKSLFTKDVELLEGLIDDSLDSVARPLKGSLEAAAVGYLSNLVLVRRCAHIAQSMKKDEFDRLVRRWASDFLSRVTSSPETPYVILRKADWFQATEVTWNPVEDFERWCSNEM